VISTNPTSSTPAPLITGSLAPAATRYLNPLQIAEDHWYEANQGPLTYILSDLISTELGSKYYEPYAMCFDGSYLWVICRNDADLLKINPYTGGIEKKVNTYLSDIYDVCFDGNNPWIISRSQNTIQELFMQPGGVTFINYPGSANRIASGKGPSAICFDGRYVWVANDGNNTLMKLTTGNKDAGVVVATYTYASSEVNGPAEICFDGTDLWVTNALSNTVSRIDVNTGGCTGTFKVGQNPKGVCFDGASIWVANSGSNTVTKMQRIGIPAGTYSVSASPKELCFDGENVWVASPEAGKVTKIRAADGKLVATYDVINPTCLCFDGVNIWVCQGSDHSLRKM
jgi:YVTN family beta-propeller protein